MLQKQLLSRLNQHRKRKNNRANLNKYPNLAHDPSFYSGRGVLGNCIT